MVPLWVRVDLGMMAMKGYFIPQSFSVTGDSPSDCLVSYPGLSLEVSYPTVEIQSMYSTASADWADRYYVTVVPLKLNLLSAKFIPGTDLFC